MKRTPKRGIAPAIAAAALYAVNAPFSKILLQYVPSVLMAGLLYLGAGLGMAIPALARRAGGRQNAETRLTRADLPYTVAMIVLDIAAPCCLMLGLASTAAANRLCEE